MRAEEHSTELQHDDFIIVDNLNTLPTYPTTHYPTIYQPSAILPIGSYIHTPNPQQSPHSLHTHLIKTTMAASRTIARPFANMLLLQPQNATHRAAPTLALHCQRHQHQQRRTFFPNPFVSEKQTLTASRTLPYPASAIYATISDVASYSKFLPYCQSSTVTKTSNPAAANNTAYPEEAKLSIGFNSDVSEEFWSRVYCVPDRVVEAVSGLTDTSLAPQEIEHHNPRPAAASDPTRNQSVLTHLATKWVLRSYPYKPSEETGESAKHITDVNLVIEYQFANPVYAALSAAAAPKVAEKMIEAFENRVKAVAEGRA